MHNIVIGGVAGAAPPMIGWAAVTGRVDPPALVLFAVVVLWTPTHFWALAVGTGTDYARANVPILPVVRGAEVAARQGAGYAIATVATSLLLPVTGVGGVGFVLVAEWRCSSVVRGWPAPHRPRRTRTQETTNVVSRITSTSLPADAEMTVHTGGLLVEVENRSGTVLTVEGYEGEPYLRIGPNGVERNRRSPATYINTAR